MNKLLLALQFLSIIPIRIKSIQPKEINRCLIYFPVVGLLIGLLLAGINQLLSGFSGTASAVFLIVSLAILTGGMHLDGLADTFDAIAGGKNKDEILRIMKDPYVGTMGLLSIVCILMLKIALLADIAAQHRASSLVLMCVVSRWAMVFAIFKFTYARTEGKAKVFFEEKNTGLFVLATLITLSISTLSGITTGLTIFAMALATAYLTGIFISKKIGGITGDNLGAINELTEAGILLFASILYN
ncbi:MAG TPA: adenosylcobinamide-GDP ribazoletransferase [Candidatus Omnitrophica bacterium]|nr:adenosylcobinamide-GDP ribazoletransferase [Candidatus Omnitrophota bacterium]